MPETSGSPVCDLADCISGVSTAYEYWSHFRYAYPGSHARTPGADTAGFCRHGLILHAGDLHCLAVLDWLEEIAPVLAARGNGDSGSGGRPVVPEDPRLRKPQVVRYHGWIVGVVHEVLNPVEMPTGLSSARSNTPSAAVPDIIVCGHTHVEVSSAMTMSGSSILAARPIHGTCKPNLGP